MSAPGKALCAGAVALGVLTAPGAAHADVECHTIDAVGVGQASADGSTTTATIRGGGLLTGTTGGTFSGTQISGTVLAIVGTVVFTPQYTPPSTLRAEVTGSIDLATGRFTASTGAVSGTGRLAGADADLVLSGTQDATGRFTETVRGTLCVDLAP